MRKKEGYGWLFIGAKLQPFVVIQHLMGDITRAARLAISSPEFVDSGKLELHLAIRNFFRLSDKFWLNSGYFMKIYLYMP